MQGLGIQKRIASRAMLSAERARCFVSKSPVPTALHPVHLIARQKETRGPRVGQRKMQTLLAMDGLTMSIGAPKEIVQIVRVGESRIALSRVVKCAERKRPPEQLVLCRFT